MMTWTKTPVAHSASLVLLITIIAAQCPDDSAPSGPCEEHLNCTGKEMCVNGWCCSVVGSAMSCPLYSYKDFVFQTNVEDTCLSDEDCPNWRKCCQTIIGKYCLQPDVQQTKCNDGSWPIAMCMDGMTCPNGYECHDNNQCCLVPRWKLRICRVNMSNDELEQLQKCESLTQCRLGENCCHTDAGYRCVPVNAKKSLRGKMRVNDSSLRKLRKFSHIKVRQGRTRFFKVA
ncbi:WAP-type 'four-disulfide core [Trichuris suis]|nr:WAP-type 'four-disulfide core [Trichuris suis]